MEDSTNHSCHDERVSRQPEESHDDHLVDTTSNELAAVTVIKPRAYPRSCVIRTLSLYTMSFCMGLSSSLFGTTLVSMERLLNTTTSRITWVHLSFAVGFIVGSLLCSALFDRMDDEMQLAVSPILSAVCGACSALTGEIYGYIILSGAQAVAMAYMTSGSNSYAMLLWTKHRLKEPLMQGLHATWSVASIISPFVIRPFLINIDVSQNSEVDTLNASSQFENISTSEGGSEPGNFTQNFNSVVYAYVTSNSFVGVSGLLFAGIFIASGNNCTKSNRLSNESNESAKDSGEAVDKSMGKTVKVAFFALICIYFGVFTVIEDCIGLYLPPLAVKGLGWSNRSGPLIAATLSVALCTGRLINVAMSAIVQPQAMLLLNMSLTAASFILMCFIKYNDVIMWVSTSLAGLATASVYPTTVLWVGEYIKMTGFVSGLMNAGGSVTSLVYPLFIGFLFDSNNPMAVVYYMLGNSLLQFLIFIAMWLVLVYSDHSKRKDAQDASEMISLDSC